MTQIDHPTDHREVSTGELVGQLSEQLSRLFRDELRLTQAELAEKGKRLGRGTGTAGAALVLTWFAVGALVCAAIAALSLVLPVWGSALIVAAVLFLVAGGLGVAARRETTRATPPIPEQAIDSTREDVRTIKEASHR